MLADIRRIYFDKDLGNKLIEVGFNGFVIPTTIEKDISDHGVLSERNRDTFDVIELPFGQYAQDFAECIGYRVNVELLATLPQDRWHEALEFSYPDPENPTEPPVFQKPLTEQIAELKIKQNVTDQVVADNGLIQQEILELLIDMGA